MLKRIVAIVIFIAMIFTQAIPVQGAIVGGVDRSKIKYQDTRGFPITLKIGTLTFNGSLKRMSELTAEEIEKAIKEALSESGKTEEEIGEAEALVRKVAEDDKFTKEDEEELRAKILDFIGAGTVVDALEVLSGDYSSIDDYLTDRLSGEIQDRLLDMLLGDAAGPAGKLIDGVIISVEEYKKDKEKWKNRADALIAKRMLNEFYRLANDKARKYAESHAQGWSLNIDNQKASRNCTFYGVEGNEEKWTVNMNLRKMDDSGHTSPSGIYKGIIFIVIDYKMSEFDRHISTKYQNYLGELFENQFDQELGLKWDYLPGGESTVIQRTLDDYEFSLRVDTWSRDKFQDHTTGFV